MKKQTTLNVNKIKMHTVTLVFLSFVWARHISRGWLVSQEGSIAVPLQFQQCRAVF